MDALTPGARRAAMSDGEEEGAFVWGGGDGDGDDDFTNPALGG